MSKPIYLPQDLCTKLQSKGLECGSGMWWVTNRGSEPEVWDMTMFSDYDTGGMVKLSDAFELHIDILGSRENLIKLWEETAGVCDNCGERSALNCKCDRFNDVGVATAWTYRAHQMLDLIHDGKTDEAINLIKEAV